MAGWRPTTNNQLITSNSDADIINSQYHATRMGVLMDTGAGRIFNESSQTLTRLVESAASNSDMVEALLTANDQVHLNELKQYFGQLPEGLQEAEFNRLPSITRNLLVGSGYSLPEPKENKNFWQRLVTWDNPLVPGELLTKSRLGKLQVGVGGLRFGHIAQVATAPISAVGMGIGAVASGGWEVLMKFSRLANRLARTGHNMMELSSEDSLQFLNGKKWIKSWGDVVQEDSVSPNAMETAVDLIGQNRTLLLRKYMRGGVDDVYEWFKEQGQGRNQSEEIVNQNYMEWYRSLGTPASIKAREALTEGALDPFNYSVHVYNRNPLRQTLRLPEMNHGTWQHKAMGMPYALGVEVLLDPLTWGGEFYTKAIRKARAGIRAGNTAPEVIDFWARMRAVERAASEEGTRFSKAYRATSRKGLDEYDEQVKLWAKANPGIRGVGGVRMNLMAQARAQNRMMDEINSAFRTINELEDAKAAIRSEMIDAGEHIDDINELALNRLAEERVGKSYPRAEMARRFPAIREVWDVMYQWNAEQMSKRISWDGKEGIEIVVHNTDDAKLFTLKTKDGQFINNDYLTFEEVQAFLADQPHLINEIASEADMLRMPALDTIEGYDQFLTELAIGEGALWTSKSIGSVTSPEAMWLPKLGSFGSRWVEGKDYMRKVLKFSEPNDPTWRAVEADFARMVGEFIADQTDYAYRRIVADSADPKSKFKLSKDIDLHTAREILENIAYDDAVLKARQMGYTPEDVVKMREYADEVRPDAIQSIIEDGHHSHLFQVWQDKGFTIGDGGKLTVQRKETAGAFSGGKNVYKNYFDQLHSRASTNGEVGFFKRMGFKSVAGASAVAYTPFRFIEKLTTYVPKSSQLQVVRNKDAIKEFQALIDMGLMANMSRSRLDHYLDTFMRGNEAQRWIVQTEFFLDYLGRTGILLAGGEPVQKFIERFLRHASAHYSAIGSDGLRIHGLPTRRAIKMSTAHAAQLSTANLIPDYRVLGELAKYMSFYRRIGWGTPLPTIDKFMARTWRPAVLLRLGYVFRNGGEELFTWMLREGPGNYVKSKNAKKATNSTTVFNEYGQKVATELTDETAKNIVLEPVARLWRTMNEVFGIGDLSITQEAIEKSIKQTGGKWAFLNDQQRLDIFTQMRKEDLRNLSGWSLKSRNGLKWAEMMSNRIARKSGVYGKKLGLPTRRKIAETIGKKLENKEKFEHRIEVIQDIMTQPTLKDAQMEGILGAYDTYLDYQKGSLASSLRNVGDEWVTAGSLNRLVTLPMDSTRSEVKWIDNSSSANDAEERSFAMATTLEHMADDPVSLAQAKMASNFVSNKQEAAFGQFAVDYIQSLPDAKQQQQLVRRGRGQSNAQTTLLAYDSLTKEAKETLYKLWENGYENGSVVTDDVIDDFLTVVPSQQRDAWEKLLRPTDDTLISPNDLAFIVGPSQFDLLTNDIDVIVDRMRKVGTASALKPEHQSMTQAAASANVSPNGPVSMPTPQGQTRIFVPVIPEGSLEDVFNILAATDPNVSANFKDHLRRTLEKKFEAIGVDPETSEKVLRLIQPQGEDLADWLATVGAYTDAQRNYFPMLTVSTNEMVAFSISEAMVESLAHFKKVPTTEIGSPGLMMKQVSSGELFNNYDQVRASTKAGGFEPIPITRGGITTTPNPQRHVNDFERSFIGINKDGEIVAARNIGPIGVKGEDVFGIHQTQLDVPSTIPVPLIGGKPNVRTVHVYRHKEGKRPPAVLRRGEEARIEDFDLDEWELTETQVVGANDLTQWAQEHSLITTEEMMHHVTSLSRIPLADAEISHTWLNEIVSETPNATRINEHAHGSDWWDKAPSELLGFVPIVGDGAGIWNSLLRNFFDGVVNPMIGAMVREPLFHHYAVLGWDQTQSLERMYWFNPGRHNNLAKRISGAGIDADGQMQIDTLKAFIKTDMTTAYGDPDAVTSKLVFAIENRNPRQIKKAADDILERAEAESLNLPVDPVTGELLPREIELTNEMANTLESITKLSDDELREFADWARTKHTSFEVHRNAAIQRGMTLAGQYIDDHRIRSQFQQMVGTAIPFWFAEDTFLRRLGRSFAHNPLMFRNLNLMMNTGVRGGVIQEDQYGNKVLVIPGNEMITNHVLEIAYKFPLVEKFFGGFLSGVVKPLASGKTALNINVIPGYNLETMGRMGFGPLLSVPINYVGNWDASVRPKFEHHLTGGRYTPDSADLLWGNVVPQILAKPLSLALSFMTDFNTAAKVKAQTDVIKLRAIQGRLPDEETIAKDPNPEVFMERNMESIAQEARFYELFQALTWFVGPGTGRISDLVTHEGWEWNQEFHDLLETGVPYEQAYEMWTENITAIEGEFDPFMYTPFKTSTQNKNTFAVLESTQDSNIWVASNGSFIDNFPNSSAFFLPRGFDEEDQDYSAEAKARMTAHGLTTKMEPDEFIRSIYYNIAFPRYAKMRNDYLSKKYAMQATGKDTVDLDRLWDADQEMFLTSHPVFARKFMAGSSREDRDSLTNEAELIVANPDVVPESEYKDDIVEFMGVVVDFQKDIRNLEGISGKDAQTLRNITKHKAYTNLSEFVTGRPWLNELYYSWFLPLIGDTWLARLNAGLIKA